MPTVLRHSHKNIQYASLLLLALQSSALTLLMRYSRTKSSNVYSSTSIVCYVEVAKLVASFVIEARNHNWNFARTLFSIISPIYHQPLSIFALAIPAFLYSIQNNLCYVALTHLSALNYQVIYQMKILTTAAFSVVFLKRRLHRLHWIALIFLMFGVVIVQLSGNTVGPSQKTYCSEGSQVKGFSALLFNSISSGFAGVHFEMISKTLPASPASSATQSKKQSLWIQSIHLGVLGLFFSLLITMFSAHCTTSITKVYTPFDWLTFSIVGLQAFGGILVAIVIRYADNIQKAFATSLSIVLCSMISVIFLGHHLPIQLVFGSALVCAAVYLYAKASEIGQRQSKVKLFRSKSVCT